MNPLWRTVIFSAPFLVGAGFYGAVAIPILFAAHRSVILTILSVAIASLVAVATYQAARHRSRADRISDAVTSAVFVLCAFGFLLLAQTGPVRFTLITGVMVALVLYFGLLDGLTGRPRGGDLAQLSLLLCTAATFFVTAFAFGIVRYVYVPMPLLAALVAGVCFWTARETIRHVSGPETEVPPLLSAAFAVLGAEAYAAFSFLPTSYLVNATASLILMVTLLYAVRHLLQCQEARPALLRRQAVFSLLLAIIVLGTARWI
ncbi:hypothetical protein AMJ57_01740 [Parcubacteria bacterium SG8_24]|nr:MAG: hypothetical protein AMJ57_01740 [Parcubacteria bacterium SG8_24]